MRTIVESARAMLYAKDLPKYLWAEAVNSAVYILNRTSNTQLEGMTSYEAWTGKKPSLDHIRTFGSEAFVHVPKEKREKLDKKSMKLILVGYDGNSTNYRLFNPITKQVTISRDATFNEGNPISVFNNHIPIVVENIQTEVADELDQIPEEEEVNIDAKRDDENQGQNSSGRNLRPRDHIKRPTRYELNFAEIDAPKTFMEAMESDDAAKWKDAIEEELEALRSNETWEVVPRPSSKTPIKSKWVFTTKRSSTGAITRYKARLCAKGYEQKSGIDFKETFSPTVRYDSIRILLAVAAKYKLSLIQFDVKTYHLNTI
ncbi:Reverse transcriptase (RNA-dependent DNA polymerase) [Popillia japonica]|uniref:Reverse transcriptase (RNA-dependent DNA polymerase) n=1 Tax=Popillia japonica TaxID=7064 RepID=A0AAW1IT93_POPJA